MHEEHTTAIWIGEKPGLTVPECLRGPDPEIRDFAESLHPEALVFDLRDPAIGDGFAWGRAADSDRIRRLGYQRVFAYRPKKSLWQRLVGRS